MYVHFKNVLDYTFISERMRENEACDVTHEQKMRSAEQHEDFRMIMKTLQAITVKESLTELKS